MKQQTESRKENRKIQLEKIKAAKAGLDPEVQKQKQEEQSKQRQVRLELELKMEKQKEEDQIEKDKLKKEIRDLKENLGRVEGQVLGLRKNREILIEESEQLKSDLKFKNYQIENLRRDMSNFQEEQTRREQERETKKLMKQREELSAKDLELKLNSSNMLLANSRNLFDQFIKNLDTDMSAKEFGVEEPPSTVESNILFNNFFIK